MVFKIYEENIEQHIKIKLKFMVFEISFTDMQRIM